MKNFIKTNSGMLLVMTVLVMIAAVLFFTVSAKAAGLALVPTLFLGMAQAFYVDQPRHSFEAVTPADLVGKEFWPVEITAAGKIQLLASGVYIGVLRERLEGSSAWNVELRGRIIKAVANGSITAPAAVKNAASGFVAASSSDKAHGIALPFPSSTIAAGDIISVMVVDHVMP